MTTTKVTIFGLGYIGLPTAALLASKGIRVQGVDTNADVVNTINQGLIHITEPNLENIVTQVVHDRLLTASLQPDLADIYLITVPTPTTTDRSPDISYVLQVGDALCSILKEDDLVILESTCPIGTTELLYQHITDKQPELKGKLGMAYCPERVLPGNIFHELQHNDRIVGGLDNQSAERARQFYQQFVLGQIFTTDSRTAEMCKLVENASRDLSIAFANELSLICHEAGINVHELIRLANRHPRVNILQPGVGVGGHCIAVDPWFIISQYPEKARLMREARSVNENKRLWVVEQIRQAAEEFKTAHHKNPVLACMGLAYKPDIDDLRESPALFITMQLIAQGMQVLPVEPHIKQHPDFTLYSVEEALSHADILIFLVKHQLFTGIPAQPIELDFCGFRETAP